MWSPNSHPVRVMACPLRFGSLTLEGPTRAVFLDRDGVLIEDTGYPDDPEALELLPGVGKGLRELAKAGWRLIVVTNQSGVARERFSLERLHEMHARLSELLAVEAVSLDALYYCPHHPQGLAPQFTADCTHRKPVPGMLLSAARELRLRLPDCWMVGDKESDVLAAHAAGCRAVRIGVPPTQAEEVARDLREAIRLILLRAGSSEA